MKSWLVRHRRFHLHFIPTSSSWLNLVERWFGQLTEKRSRRGSFFSVEELVQAIHEYLEENNRQPKPFSPSYGRRVNYVLEWPSESSQLSVNER